MDSDGKYDAMKRISGKMKRYRNILVAAACTGILAILLFSSSCSSSSSPSGVPSTFIRKRKSPFFASPPDTPKIVWLMTLPDAGSSFVMSLVARATGFSTATNYGDDVTKEGNPSLSIDPRGDEGPYWPGLGGTTRKLPTTHVLVQTYCRTKTTPHIPTQEQYMHDCVTTFGRTAPDTTKLTEHSYSTSRVNKAIHLMRNPLTQIITKFQKEYKSHLNDTGWTKRHPNTNEGFLKWCQEEDDQKLAAHTEYYSAGTVQIMGATMCHHYVAEYVNWHNMAFETVSQLQIPELIVYHEEMLDSKLESMLDRMLDFLQLDKQSMPTQRLGDAEVDVKDFLSKTQQRQIRRLVQRMAKRQTWEHIQHYFQDVM